MPTPNFTNPALDPEPVPERQRELVPATADERPVGGASHGFEALLDAVLSAHRAGTLDELLRRRPRLTLRLQRRYLGPVVGAAGDALRGDGATAAATALLLRWAVQQLRPDPGRDVADLGRDAWLQRTSWRPMLALMCHYGFATVPDFPDRYRRHRDESPADNLCGLWSIGPSTFYRALDKGRHALAGLLRELPRSGDHRLSLRAAAQAEAYRRLDLDDSPARSRWHTRQAADALTARDALSALWHQWQALDLGGFTTTLQRFCIELAAHRETDSLLAAVSEQAVDARWRFELALSQAGLWRSRYAAERERESLEQALRIAQSTGEPLMLGLVYGALGKYHELRDTDRAFACYQDSVEYLRQAESSSGDDSRTLEEHVATLVKLAWLYVLKNDPRSRALLDRAAALRDAALAPLADATAALLEQTWGEYWRRSGDLPRALEHKHAALNIYERLGDQPQMLKTYGNLALIYGEAQDFDRAIEHSRRVLDLADRIVVEPEIVASTHMNLGVTHFWQADYTRAIAEYTAALDIARRASLQLVVRRAHYNLAEAYFKRFQLHADAEDEALGDRHVADALAAWPENSDPVHAEATRNLKAEILGPGADRAYDRLLPQETAAHAAEMSEVLRQRARLALPGEPAAQVRAHLAIAHAYLAIAVKERETARSLIDRHALGSAFDADFERLRSTFDRALSREERCAQRWRREAADLLDESRIGPLVTHLLQAGAIGKSGYAQVCGVALATASKHLGLLAERGLLVQTGKGPSTRYLLAD